MSKDILLNLAVEEKDNEKSLNDALKSVTAVRIHEEIGRVEVKLMSIGEDSTMPEDALEMVDLLHKMDYFSSSTSAGWSINPDVIPSIAMQTAIELGKDTMPLTDYMVKQMPHEIESTLSISMPKNKAIMATEFLEVVLSSYSPESILKPGGFFSAAITAEDVMKIAIKYGAKATETVCKIALSDPKIKHLQGLNLMKCQPTAITHDYTSNSEDAHQHYDHQDFNAEAPVAL